MESFFSFRCKNFFRIFSMTHILALCILLFCIVLLLVWVKDKPEKWKKRFQYTLSALALLLQCGYMTWLVWNGLFQVKFSLPLDICSVSLLIVFVSGITENRVSTSLLCFWGMIGAGYALFFPNLLYSFPHFRFFQFFAAHGLILLTVVYFLWIRRYRLHLRDVFLSYAITAVYLFSIRFLNAWWRTNYLYLQKKPAFPSFFDWLGENYFFSLLLAVFFLFFGIYLLLFLISGKFHSTKTFIEEEQQGYE